MSHAITALHAPEFLKLIAHDLRWQILKVLSIGDYQVNELVEVLGEKMNLVSYHLKKLRDEKLVLARRSEADSRDIYYSLDIENLQAMYSEAGALLHPRLGFLSEPAAKENDKLKEVLFVCSHNAARSQMAEGLLRHYGAGQVTVASAGTIATSVHPEAIGTMAEMGIDIGQQRSKSLEQFEGEHFDYVITVCDHARESCPSFQGAGQQRHWGFPDPSQITDEGERALAFREIATRLKSRVHAFLEEL